MTIHKVEGTEVSFVRKRMNMTEYFEFVDKIGEKEEEFKKLSEFAPFLISEGTESVTRAGAAVANPIAELDWLDEFLPLYHKLLGVLFPKALAGSSTDES